MSYVEICEKHGQHHSEICGECYEDLQAENTRIQIENSVLLFTLKQTKELLKDTLAFIEAMEKLKT